MDGRRWEAREAPLRWQASDPWADIRAHATATYDQRAWRFRNDDGDEVTATWKAAQNVAVANQPIGEIFRLRFEIQETGGSAESRMPSLQFSLDGGSTWAGDTFGMSETSSSAVRMHDTHHVANETATTDQLTAGAGTFGAGNVWTTSNGGVVSAIPASGHTEWEWALELNRDATWTNGQTVLFRVLLSDGGTTPVVTDTSTAGNASLTVDSTLYPPAQVTGLKLDTAELHAIQILWNNESLATAYDVEMDGSVLGAVGETSGTVTSARISPLKAGTTYTFRVRGTNAAGAGPWSAPLEATTLGVALAGTAPAASLAGAELDVASSGVVLAGVAAASASAEAVLGRAGDQRLPPVTQIGALGWRDQDGGTSNLHLAVDEVHADDTDYITVAP